MCFLRFFPSPWQKQDAAHPTPPPPTSISFRDKNPPPSPPSQGIFAAEKHTAHMLSGFSLPCSLCSQHLLEIYLHRTKLSSPRNPRQNYSLTSCRKRVQHALHYTATEKLSYERDKPNTSSTDWLHSSNKVYVTCPSGLTLCTDSTASLGRGLLCISNTSHSCCCYWLSWTNPGPETLGRWPKSTFYFR